MSFPKIALLLVLAAATARARASAPPQGNVGPLAADPVLQQSIARVVSAPGEVEQRAALDALRAVPPARLVPQLFLYSSAASDTRAAMAMAFVVHELPLTEDRLVEALVPLLEGADAARRRALGGVLSAVERRSLDGADFQAYREHVEGRELAPGLARYLFEVDPGAALRLVARAQVPGADELRPLLWAEHEVADALWKLDFGFVAPADVARLEPGAVQELGRLARHPRWWARLYAAEVAGRAPSLAGDVSLEALRRDEHALVREAAGGSR